MLCMKEGWSLSGFSVASAKPVMLTKEMLINISAIVVIMETELYYCRRFVPVKCDKVFKNVPSKFCGNFESL